MIFYFFSRFDATRIRHIDACILVVWQEALHSLDPSMFASLRKPAAVTEVSIRKARKSTYVDPLRDKSKEYTTEELDDLKAYLSDFYRTIYSRREECRKICEQNPKTVGHFFDTLVPRHVTFEDFWQRYFYRCDPDRVTLEWDRKAAAQKQQLDQKIQDSMHSAQQLWTNTLGGAKTEILDAQQATGVSVENLSDDVDSEPFTADTFVRDRSQTSNMLKSAIGDSQQHEEAKQADVPDLSPDSMPSNTQFPDLPANPLPPSITDVIGVSSEGNPKGKDAAFSDGALSAEISLESERVAPSSQVAIGQELLLGFSSRKDVPQPDSDVASVANELVGSISGATGLVGPSRDTSVAGMEPMIADTTLTWSLVAESAPEASDAMSGTERAVMAFVEPELQAAETLEAELPESAKENDEHFDTAPVEEVPLLDGFSGMSTFAAANGDTEVCLSSPATEGLLDGKTSRPAAMMLEQPVRCDNPYVLSDSTAEVSTKAEATGQDAIQTAASTPEVSSISTIIPLEATSREDSKGPVEPAAKASKQEAILVHQKANVSQEFRSTSENPLKITITGSNEVDANIEVEQNQPNSNEMEPFTASKHTTEVEETQCAMTILTSLSIDNVAANSDATATSAKSSIAESQDSACETMKMEAICLPEESHAESSGQLLNDTDTEVKLTDAGGAQSDPAMPHSARSLSLGLSSDIDIARADQDLSNEASSDCSSPAVAVYISRGKRLMDIRNTPTSARKELEMLRQSKGDSSIKNLKAFWNEKSASPATSIKKVLELSGSFDKRPPSPVTSWAQPRAKLDAESLTDSRLPKKTAVADDNLSEERRQKVTPATVADDMLAGHATASEATKEGQYPSIQVTADEEDMVASKAAVAYSTIAETTEEPLNPAPQATMEGQYPLQQVTTEVEDTVAPRTVIAVSTTSETKEEQLNRAPEATMERQDPFKQGTSDEEDKGTSKAVISVSACDEATKDQLNSVKHAATAAEDELTVQATATKASKELQQHCVQEVTVAKAKLAELIEVAATKELSDPAKPATKIDENKVTPDVVVEPNTDKQHNQVKRAATVTDDKAAVEATIADATKKGVNPLKEATSVAEVLLVPPAAIVEPTKEQLDPVMTATVIAQDKSDPHATVDMPIRESPSIKATKTPLMSLKSLMTVTCVAFLAFGAATTVWWQQDYLCAPAMGTLTRGPSDAPFWAPPAYKSILFGPLCGLKPKIRLQWTQTKGGLFALVIEEEGSVLVKRDRLVSATVTPTHISVTNKRGTVEQLEAPWAFKATTR